MCQLVYSRARLSIIAAPGGTVAVFLSGESNPQSPRKLVPCLRKGRRQSLETTTQPASPALRPLVHAVYRQLEISRAIFEQNFDHLGCLLHILH